MLLRLLSAVRSATERLQLLALRRSAGDALSLGAGARLRAPLDVVIEGKGFLGLGSRTVVERRSSISVSGRLTVGTGCYFSIGTVLGCEREVTIGDRVAVGPYCVILDTSKAYTDTGRPIIGQGHEHAPVTIADDVWIGAGVTVLPGATIGSHTVVAAGSVVRGDIPARVVVGGVPARILRQLG